VWVGPRRRDDDGRENEGMIEKEGGERMKEGKGYGRGKGDRDKKEYCLVLCP